MPPTPVLAHSRVLQWPPVNALALPLPLLATLACSPQALLALIGFITNQASPCSAFAAHTLHPAVAKHTTLLSLSTPCTLLSLSTPCTLLSLAVATLLSLPCCRTPPCCR